MAQAAARFAEACMRAMGGEPGVVECAYVASSLTDLPYFASQLRLGPAGIEGACSRGLGGGRGAGAAGCRAARAQGCGAAVGSRATGVNCTCWFAAPPALGVHTALRASTAVDSRRPLLSPHRAEFLPLPRLNALEQENFERMKAELQASIQKGLEFVRK